MKLLLTLATLLGLAALLSACGMDTPTTAPTQAAAGGPAHCTFPHFTATVRQGPEAGTTLAGALTLDADAQGHLTGQLAPAQGAAIAVTGQASGQAINLYFDTGAGISGAGTLQHDLGACSGGGGGPFSGPNPGDLGDWGVTCGFFCPTPTPAPPHAPILSGTTWNSNGKIQMTAAGSYIQDGATLLVTRSGIPVQSYTLHFDTSGTLLVAGGPNAPSTPGNYLMSNLVPAGIPSTLQVRNLDGLTSNVVNFQH